MVGQSVIKNQPCDVIKMREMRGELGKKIPKKRWIILNFFPLRLSGGIKHWFDPKEYHLKTGPN